MGKAPEYVVIVFRQNWLASRDLGVPALPRTGCSPGMEMIR
jgi:hypothetical protein